MLRCLPSETGTEITVNVQLESVSLTLFSKFFSNLRCEKTRMKKGKQNKSDIGDRVLPLISVELGIYSGAAEVR